MGQISSPNRSETRSTPITISFDQLIQIIEAILEGRYSWACVLLLRFAGFNPLHYIPYRTYNRLIKLKLVNTNENNGYPQEIGIESKQDNQDNSMPLANQDLAAKLATKLIDRKNTDHH